MTVPAMADSLGPEAELLLDGLDLERVGNDLVGSFGQPQQRPL